MQPEHADSHRLIQTLAPDCLISAGRWLLPRVKVERQPSSISTARSGARAFRRGAAAADCATSPRLVPAGLRPGTGAASVGGLVERQVQRPAERRPVDQPWSGPHSTPPPDAAIEPSPQVATSQRRTARSAPLDQHPSLELIAGGEAPRLPVATSSRGSRETLEACSAPPARAGCAERAQDFITGGRPRTAGALPLTFAS